MAASDYVLTQNEYCCDLVSVTPDGLGAGTIVFTVDFTAGDHGASVADNVTVTLSPSGGGGDLSGSQSTITGTPPGTMSADVSVLLVTAETWSVTVTIEFSDTTYTCVLSSTDIVVTA